jgi:integrase
MIRTGATVADACAEYLRYIEQDRQRKPSTLCDYDSIFRNHVIPQLGSIRLEDLTPDRVESWAAH